MKKLLLITVLMLVCALGVIGCTMYWYDAEIILHEDGEGDCFVIPESLNIDGLKEQLDE